MVVIGEIEIVAARPEAAAAAVGARYQPGRLFIHFLTPIMKRFIAAG
jgi:hypothetical protein